MWCLYVPAFFCLSPRRPPPHPYTSTHAYLPKPALAHQRPPTHPPTPPLPLGNSLTQPRLPMGLSLTHTAARLEILAASNLCEDLLATWRARVAARSQAFRLPLPRILLARYAVPMWALSRPYTGTI